MPVFDYECSKCNNVWENVEVWPSHAPKNCPKCKSKKFNRIFSSVKQQVRMGALRETPDPSPPLTELKSQTDSESGFSDLPRTELKDYTRTKDKHGNSIWKEKRRTYFHPGMGSRKSSAEKE